MKKFEALERVQKLAEAQKQASRPAQADVTQAAEAAPADDGGGEQMLTEEQLLEVFKQTSAFSVKTVQNNGACSACVCRPRIVSVACFR